MASSAPKRTAVGRLVHGGIFVWGTTLISIGIVGVGIFAVTSWLKAPPEQRAGGRDMPIRPDAAATDSKEAAVTVARDFVTFMLGRRFDDAAFLATGAAADMVRAELEVRMSHQAMKDPELMKIIDEGLSGRVVSFEPLEVKVGELGNTAAMRVKMRVVVGGEEHTTTARIELTLSERHWQVQSYVREGGAPGGARP